MATSDLELIQEVRNLTGYTDTSTFSDNHIQSIVDIAKEELRSYLNDPSFTFFVDTANTNTHDADRALFWFTCIGLKVATGEIGAPDLSISSLDKSQDEGQYSFWFDMLWSRLKSAASDTVTGASSTQITRDGRDYDYDTYNV